MIENKDKSHAPKWRVLFATRGVGRKYSLSAEEVLIIPANDDWNDFGNRTLVNLKWLPDLDKPAIELTARIGFLTAPGEAKGREHIGALMGDAQSPLLAMPDMRFFLMLPALEDYRSLVTANGVERARSLLLALNDLVALQEFNKAPEWLEEAERSDIVALSFFRNSTSYFAYKNAGPILRGLEFETLGRLSQSLQLEIQRAGADKQTLMRFEFDHAGELPKRIAVIIGKNGVGKSQTLAAIARAAIRGEKSLTEGDGKSRVMISRLLAFAPTNEAESVFPSERFSKSRIWYRRFSLNRARRSKRGEYLSDLIVQVARSQEAIQEKARWDLFLEATKAISSPEQLAIPTLDGNFVFLSSIVRGGEQAALECYQSLDIRREPMRAVVGSLYPLSSGELTFIKFAAQVCLHIENGSLVLLDEPETHLHPNFISRFVSLIDTLLELTGSSAILATHSAYLVKEVFRDQVTVLRLINDQLDPIKPTLQTFGADVGAISYFVFGEDEPTKLATKLRQELLTAYPIWEDLYARYKDEFSLEYLNALRLAVEQ